jgi:hypothetical protein
VGPVADEPVAAALDGEALAGFARRDVALDRDVLTENERRRTPAETVPEVPVSVKPRFLRPKTALLAEMSTRDAPWPPPSITVAPAP